MLSQKGVEEFTDIYRQVFGEDIDLIEAERRAIALLRLYKIVLKPKPTDKERKTYG